MQSLPKLSETDQRMILDPQGWNIAFRDSNLGPTDPSRTTKSFLDSRPVFLQHSDRIRAHFLICFLAMVILEMLQKQFAMPGFPIDDLIAVLRSFKFAHITFSLVNNDVSLTRSFWIFL